MCATRTVYANSFETLQIFGHGLKMCMWFGYNPRLILLHFSQVELCHFSGVIGQWVPFVCATPPTILCPRYAFLRELAMDVANKNIS